MPCTAPHFGLQMTLNRLCCALIISNSVHQFPVIASKQLRNEDTNILLSSGFTWLNGALDYFLNCRAQGAMASSTFRLHYYIIRLHPISIELLTLVYIYRFQFFQCV